MIHLIKLAVGCEDIEHMLAFQAHRLDQYGHVFHTTRATPKRADDLTEGGSIYWVIRGHIAARQLVVEVLTEADDEGRARCRLILDAAIVPVEGRPCKAFQGWRYLDPANAPADCRPGHQEPPPEMAEELRRLGLL
jgi:hypothetical protein